MVKRLIYYICAAQITIVIVVCINIYYKKNADVGNYNVLGKESISSNASSKLRHFYEPKPNSVEVVNLKWLGQEYDYNVTYNINSDSLNQFPNYIPEKEKDTIRIITVGDSFTFGTNVNTKDNYPSQLQNILNTNCLDHSYEVINLGVAGYDMQYVIERMKLRGVKYNPDIVVWFLITDDFLRFSEKLIPLAKEIGPTLRKTKEYDRLLKEGIYYPSWYIAKKQIIKDLGGEQEALRLQQKYISDIDKYYTNKLVFSFYPKFQKKYRNILEQIVDKRPKTYINPNMRDIYELDGGLPDKHPNEKGYKIMAEDVFKYLKENKLIPCN